MTATPVVSDDSAVGAQRLTVDPRAIRPGEKGDSGGDVGGRTEPLERRELREPLDQLRRFAVEEEIGRGGIINFSSSVVGLLQPKHGVYAATKAAIEAMTSVLAKEMRGRGITVNASIDSVEGHRMIGLRSLTTGNLRPLEFVVDRNLRYVTLPAPMSVTGTESYLATTRLGLGLAQIPRFHGAQDFERGTLVRVLTDFPPRRFRSRCCIRKIGSSSHGA